tara:strand:- start:1246 stop:1689 length:444 start_codon:yes stop_codon:yes gene_type:complete
MAPQPFIYFLKWVAHYHKALQMYYERASHQRHNPEVNALLAYLGQHEGTLAHIIESYEYDAPRSLLNAWFKISPVLVHIREPESMHFDADTSVSEVIDQVLKIDDGLIAVYKMLLRQANSEELREALENLINEEQREEMRLMACEQL